MLEIRSCVMHVTAVPQRKRQSDVVSEPVVRSTAMKKKRNRSSAPPRMFATLRSGISPVEHCGSDERTFAPLLNHFVCSSLAATAFARRNSAARRRSFYFVTTGRATCASSATSRGPPPCALPKQTNKTLQGDTARTARVTSSHFERRTDRVPRVADARRRNQSPKPSPKRQQAPPPSFSAVGALGQDPASGLHGGFNSSASSHFAVDTTVADDVHALTSGDSRGTMRICTGTLANGQRALTPFPLSLTEHLRSLSRKAELIGLRWRVQLLGGP